MGFKRLNVGRGSQMLTRIPLVSLLVFGLVASCDKKEEGETTKADTSQEQNNNKSNDPNGGTHDEKTGPSVAEGGVPVAGTIAITLGLNSGKAVTHVVALNTASGKSYTSEVEDDGSFQINIARDEPWVLSYVDSTKVGPEMIVSRFASGSQ